MVGLGRRLWLGSFLLSLIAGCGGGGEASLSASGLDEKGFLQTLGEDYRMFSISQKKPPRKMADMEVMNTMLSAAMNEVRSGNIIVQWGATLPDLKEEPGQSTAPEILAYGKDVPEKGGYVLHLDRTVTKMTAEEFKAAPKAGAKAGS